MPEHVTAPSFDSNNSHLQTDEPVIHTGMVPDSLRGASSLWLSSRSRGPVHDNAFWATLRELLLSEENRASAQALGGV
jgi:hypothetical protein